MIILYLMKSWKVKRPAPNKGLLPPLEKSFLQEMQTNSLFSCRCVGLTVDTEAVLDRLHQGLDCLGDGDGDDDGDGGDGDGDVGLDDLEVLASYLGLRLLCQVPVFCN